jgi:hypothetical protein
LTLAELTPGVAAIAFSTRPTQLAQVMPSTGISTGGKVLADIGGLLEL